MKQFSLFKCLFLLLTFCACQNTSHVNVWLIGDSTMAAKKSSRRPESGWGVALADMTTKHATVHNHAASGRSTLSFINQKRWSNVRDSLKKGDYVVMQFGHNDAKTDIKLHTTPFGTFKENLKKFIDETRTKGAIPVVCSSIVRRHFDAAGHLIDTHGDYIDAAKQIAQETNTPYIDMEALTRKMVSDLGPQASAKLYNFTSRKRDSTHVNVTGAAKFAALFVRETAAQKLPLAQWFTSENASTNNQ